MTRPSKARLLSDAEATDEHDTASASSDASDTDAPRVAQWIDDDALNSDAERDDDAGPSHTLQSLEQDLSTLPLGALRRAQRTLARAHTLSDSGPSDDDAPSEEEHHPAEPTPDRLKRTKRTNKHAPTEVTSKRPVSRRRTVVDDTRPKPRDPRFMHAAGHYDPSKFKHQYAFLSGLRTDELQTLREHLGRARKLLVNAPADLRPEREAEVDRLDRAMKKAESAVNQDSRERVESTALQSAKQAEKERRQKGKAGWWMKQSEKKALLAKARLDAIASAGGKRAVKKALEKKQKKQSQKEKKMRPFPRSGEGKRRPAGPIDSGRAKRRKVS